MASVKDVLSLAREQIGTTEKPPGSNRTKYGEAYGLNGYAWCLQFAWWVLTKCGVPMIKSAYTPTAADWFADQKRGFSNDSKAKPGDLVFFNFPDSLDRIQHVGFVVENTGTGLITIEGNTSAGSSGSQDNGGGVFQRTRGYGEAVYFGRPAYVEELPEWDLPTKKTWFGRGDSGADVRNWQRDLNGWVRDLKDKDFDFKLEVDGKFEARTVKATLTFQKFYGLDADARVGRHTLAKMERIRDRQDG